MSASLPGTGALWCVCSAFIVLMSTVSCAESKTHSETTGEALYSVAFLPDVHFHDVYASFTDHAFTGIETENNSPAVLRTMQAQLHSTRLFNENYFALIAALDDLAARGVDYVALPGDFSDDGQPLHLRGLAEMLRRYESEYGMRFLIAPGNHDPVRPFDAEGGKPDFLGSEGQPVAIYSHGHEMCADNPKADICSDELIQLGYAGIFEYVGEFGLQPRSDDVHWETPYSSLPDSAGSLDARLYEACHQGAATYIESGTNCVPVVDASYLVEPVEGLWLLAIDANVYQPKEKPSADALSADNFHSSGNAGYNRLLTHKPHLLKWVADVVQRADQEGKTLLAFSHYPMIDFYNGMSGHIAETFGKQNFQLARVPQPEVSQVFADTGLRVHVAGHMHFNHTSITQAGHGGALVNIQAPSIAGYLPAYKLLTAYSSGAIEVETIVLNEVPGFDTFFPLYKREHQSYLMQFQEPPWPVEVLQSSSYAEFTEWHIRELARQRFLPREWPQAIRDNLLNADALQLLEMLGIRAEVNQANIDAESVDWNWTGLDLATDFYRIRNAGTLGLQDIPDARMQAYNMLYEAAQRAESEFAHQLEQVLFIMRNLQDSENSDHFWIMPDGAVKPDTEVTYP